MKKTNLDIRPIITSLVEWIKLEKEDPEFVNEINLGITLWDRQM